MVSKFVSPTLTGSGKEGVDRKRVTSILGHGSQSICTIMCQQFSLNLNAKAGMSLVFVTIMN